MIEMNFVGILTKVEILKLIKQTPIESIDNISPLSPVYYLRHNYYRWKARHNV